MPRANKPCATPRCPRIVLATSKRSRCDGCERDAERARGTAHQRGYGKTHRDTFRAGVLARDPVCVLCATEPSTVADHHPLSRRDLVARRLDPNDPKRGRGLCASCHSGETVIHQPGGWFVTDSP